MLVFPQFATGAAALYPVTRQNILRTVVNTLGDGSTVVYTDPDAAQTSWEISAKGLTLAEWSSIESLFAAVSGQWQTFTLLDPTGNLLADSEALGAGAWTNGALIELTTGIADPLGTTRATRVVNGGIAVEAVTQTLGAPGNFLYCLSVWARTVGGSSVTATASTTRGELGSGVSSEHGLAADCFSSEFGAGDFQRYVWREFGGGWIGGLVWDPGGGSVGRFGLQGDWYEQRHIFGGSVWFGRDYGYGSEYGCL